MARKTILAGIAPPLRWQWHVPQFRPQLRTNRGEGATCLRHREEFMPWLEQRQQAQVTLSWSLYDCWWICVCIVWLWSDTLFCVWNLCAKTRSTGLWATMWPCGIYFGVRFGQDLVLVCRCPVEVEGRVYKVNLICLPLQELEVILGMNWLFANRILIDCQEKNLLFPNSEEPELLSSQGVVKELQGGA